MKLCHYFESMATALFMSNCHCLLWQESVSSITLYCRIELFSTKCLNIFRVVRTRTFINMA
ncbi:hypothetical protein EMIT0215P_60248 [Pseudomonas serboccidentalis]